MKYVKPYNEDSIPFNSELVDLFNTYKAKSIDIVKYFKEYFGMTKVDLETDLNDFLERYLDWTKGKSPVLNMKENLKKIDLYYIVELSNPNYQQIKFKFKLHIGKDISILIDGNRPVNQVVSDFIRFECKNGRKFIEICKKLKENSDIAFVILHTSQKSNLNLFGENIDLESITRVLNPNNTFDKNTLIKIAPMIFKFGTDDEVKRFWDKINRNYNTIMQIFAKDKEAPKPGYPDCRGYLNRLKNLIDLDDIKISNTKNLGEMGFSD